MIFALDFDGTFDRDPELFRVMIVLIQSRGHQVVCVTSRIAGINDEVEKTVGEIPIVYADTTWKRQAARVAGYSVNVWIDDLPEYVDAQDPELVELKQFE